MEIEKVYEIAQIWDKEEIEFLESLDRSMLDEKQIEFVESATDGIMGTDMNLGCRAIAFLMHEAASTDVRRADVTLWCPLMNSVCFLEQGNVCAWSEAGSCSVKDVLSSLGIMADRFSGNFWTNRDMDGECAFGVFHTNSAN